MIFGFTKCSLAAISLIPVIGICSDIGASSDGSEWPNWPLYRQTVKHPAGLKKENDIERAQANLQRHQWARNYLKSLEAQASPWLGKCTPESLQQMIPETTPGVHLMTPCPECRKLGKPYYPHGNWIWRPSDPEKLTCQTCSTVFPHPDHPEDIVIKSTWGRPQEFTFVGGEPFQIFNYTGRPSLTGTIRAQKANFMAALVAQMGEIYALTGNIAYAEGAKAILLRMAEVYPNWLVQVGYGEYADMEPAIASRRIQNLPTDELVYPPNKPDRKLHTGYWSAGRASGIGMEGIWLQKVASAYDLTCAAKDSAGQPIYSEADRKLVERDLLLEGTLLLSADPSLNNKSVANLSAAALVGMITGEPNLIRAGIKGFEKTTAQWFLPDGGTPESPAYSVMALQGAVDFAHALRGYSDPEGYVDASGKRYDNYNPYQQEAYARIWAEMVNSLQGNLVYPPFADSYQSTSIGKNLAEYLLIGYPEKLEYLSLMKELVKNDWHNVVAPIALYCADPDRQERETPPLTFKSYILPDLRIGFMRSGADGRESLLILSASHWGIHHHQDSLNLYYWKQGDELLTDLGYLWDHPDQRMTVRTFAHNTVMIDEQEQKTSGRGGEVRYFIDNANFKAMRAASTAYANAGVYERAVALIEHGDGQNYVVDLFWVQGGNAQDYIYHGPNANWEGLAAPALTPTEPKASVFSLAALYQRFRAKAPESPAPTFSLQPFGSPLFDLKDVKKIEGSGSYILRWAIGEERQFTFWNLPQAGESAFVAEGWGQRNHKNSDKGVTIPYIVRRTTGPGLQSFVSAFEAHKRDVALVKSVEKLPVEDSPEGVTALMITTRKSRDYVVFSKEARPLAIETPDGTLESTGQIAILSVSNGEIQFSGSDTGAVNLKR